MLIAGVMQTSDPRRPALEARSPNLTESFSLLSLCALRAEALNEASILNTLRDQPFSRFRVRVSLTLTLF